MKIRPRLIAIAGLLSVLIALPSPAAAQTAPKTVQPGAPGEPSRTLTPEELQARTGHQYTKADVAFMQGMIPHHGQALEMTGLVPTRTDRRDMHLLAQRIEVAQGDEIAWMQRWLQDNGQKVPALDAHQQDHGAHHQMLMPGMLSREEMSTLAAATGDAFDRLFLFYMIRHHEGALVMVRDLLAAPGAAQVPEVFRFAADIDADQQADIQRMRAMLEATPPLDTPAPASHHH